MLKTQPVPRLNLVQTIKKSLLSGLVMVTFAVYAIHERSESGVRPPKAGPAATTRALSQPSPTDLPPGNGYGDGVYLGDSTDAFYGNVQVKAIIQGGKITDVQFVDYPHDRRTSQFINQQAIPYLKSEAIQAQSAQVDIISGATLTSRAFIESLGSALDKANKAKS